MATQAGAAATWITLALELNDVMTQVFLLTIADLEDQTAFRAYYAITQALIRDLDTRLAIAEAELATIE